MTTHFMIDLETLGTTPQAPILSIGAVAFDPDTGQMDEGCDVTVDLASAMEGRHPDAGTIQWWLSQEATAQTAAFSGKASLSLALDILRAYLHAQCNERGDRVVWGNGATFDISMLEDAYRQYRKGIPWDFWNVRDVRTITDLCRGFISKRDFAFEGTAHCALDDARYQAFYVSKMWQAVRDGLQWTGKSTTA